MSDFAQAGLICTLQRLNETHLGPIEAKLPALAAAAPVTLILPCHGGDLDRPALAHICTELAGASWLREIIVSLNGLNAEGFARAGSFFAQLPQRVRILWNDGPVLTALHSRLLGCAPEQIPHGKGLNVWAATGVVCAEAQSAVLLTQDCDVTSFRRATLARLCYAAAHPRLGFAFAKMYYSRVTDRLYGRVSRLFLAPLLQGFVRVAGHQPLLDFLLSFRYPLAGECAIRRELATTLPTSPGWGLEIGALCSVFRGADPRAVCQVDGGRGYDHKHQPVASSLRAMCVEIAETLFAQLAEEGLSDSPAFREAIVSAYRREGALALQRSSALALINGLPFDETAEAAIVETFAAALTEPAARTATASAPLPPWSRLLRENPVAVSDLLAVAN